MRQQFIECATKAEAENEATWASVIIEVEGGYMAFESVRDAETFENQK